VIVHSARPTFLQVQAALRAALPCGKKSIDDVAQLLFVSTSTLQRVLADSRLDFTQLRKEVQVEVALELLTQGKSARTVAAEVGLSRDHLCVLVRRATDLTPSQIIRATKLDAKVRRWRKYGPPPYGSPLYREQFRQWQEIDAGLQALFADLSADHPLATWAKKLLVGVARPDFRTQPHRGHIRDLRKREADELAARIRRIQDQWNHRQNADSREPTMPLREAA
jgi:AraC-like DNA-binding protein